MKVAIYFGKDKLATGIVGADGIIRDVEPHDGKGMGYGRYVQVTILEGKHAGRTISDTVMSDANGELLFKELFPYQ